MVGPFLFLHSDGGLPVETIPTLLKYSFLHIRDQVICDAAIMPLKGLPAILTLDACKVISFHTLDLLSGAFVKC